MWACYLQAMRLIDSALTLVLLCACGGEETSPSAAPSDPTALAPPPKGQGFQLTMDAVAPASSEIWICDVKPMPNEQWSNVNRVEVKQTEGTHHMTLSTLGLFESGQIAHGRYDCDDLYGDSSLMENQIMFYGNQGSAQDEMQLPTGVAATLPSGLDVIHEIHFVNPTTEDVALYSRINAWTIPNEELLSGIWGGSVRDEHIAIPPSASHTEWSRCVFNEDVEIIFLASHTHKLGESFQIRPFDGSTVGDLVYENDDWHVPAITQYDPPLVVPAGSGFEWSCTWNNTTPETVGYGPSAADEMCNMAVVHMPFSTSAACEVVETSDGVLHEEDAED
jgi:Copper type II ascorbate-dependent monooxygenase, C-terminal domain